MVILLIQNDLQEVIVMIFDNKPPFIIAKDKAEEFLNIKSSTEHNEIIEKRSDALRKILKDETK